MSDTFRSTPPNQHWSGGNSAGNGYQGAFGSESQPGEGENDVGKALLIGLLGGLASAAGYMVYRRLPEDQKERLHAQIRSVVAQRITELRQNFNI